MKIPFTSGPSAKAGHWSGVDVGDPLRLLTVANVVSAGTDTPALRARGSTIPQPGAESRSSAASGPAPSALDNVHQGSPAHDDALVPRRSTEFHSDRTPTYAGNTSPAKTTRVAILVSHGMGQQLPFQTVDAVVEALCTKYTANGKLPKPQIKVRYVAFQEDWTPRAELTFLMPGPHGDRVREVHVYESYWAPLTEGEVSIRDVFSFILGAAVRGLRYGRAGFGRYLFDGYVPCGLSTLSWMFLALAFAVIMLTGFASLTFMLTAITQGISMLHMPEWRSSTLPVLWRIVLWPTSALATFLLVGTGLSLVVAPMFESIRRALRAEKIFAAAVTGLVLIAAGATLADHAAVWSDHDFARIRESETVRWWALVLLAVLIFFLQKAKNIIVQYLGDVAVYVSAYTVNRFWKIRSQIQATGRTLARNVYGAHENGELLYDKVLIVGHSLGSVIAYDMLNDSIQRDLVLLQANQSNLCVVERTPLLLTFGSPLDKVAFFFRTQADALATREALSSATQPLIREYALRPANWINIWSPFDWISGALDYYDALRVGIPPDPREVINKIDPEAPLFISGAHPGYWKRKMFRETLYQAVVEA